MCALVFSNNTDEEPLSSQQPFSICPKCGRFIKINGHCECEMIFLRPFVNRTKKEK